MKLIAVAKLTWIIVELGEVTIENTFKIVSPESDVQNLM